MISKLLSVLKWGVFLALFLGFMATAGVIIYIVRVTKDLPDFEELAVYEPPVTSRVHAGDGTLIAEFARENRVYVPVTAIPDSVIQAFLSVEDKSFYKHKGVAWSGVARASLANIKHALNDERLEGASTITQQVAKNFLLSRERKLKRKVREMVLAYRIERAYSKDRILELYLNEIYLGHRSYGVAAAALNYFNKSLDELSFAEMAYLAALPKAPNNYDPVRHKTRAIERRNWALDRMQANGYITEEQAEAAKAEDLVVNERFTEEFYTVAADFVEEIRRHIKKIYGDRALYDGGLSVRSTLDMKLQYLAHRVLREGLEAYDRRHGWRGPLGRIQGNSSWQEELKAFQEKNTTGFLSTALVLDIADDGVRLGFVDGTEARMAFEDMAWARPITKKGRPGPKPKKPQDVLEKGDVILVEALGEGDQKTYALRQIPKVNGAMMALDPHTGRVLALIGGYNFGQSEFNRATQALRQPGSAFKPFVYAAALDQGYTPVTKILDAPFTLVSGGKVYSPRNYSKRYYGPSTMRRGLEKSRNVMTVRLASDIGLDHVVDYGKKFGIYDDLLPVPAMALGAGETTLWRLTAAYAMLVNNGKRVVPTVIDRIQDRWGKTIYTHNKPVCPSCSAPFWEGQDPPDLPDEREQVLDPVTAFQVVWMLKGVIDRGTGARLKSLGKTLGGKTGTTNDYQDAWFMGFSPDLVVGVYVGFDEPHSLGHAETGGRVAAPIFQAFMEKALAQKPDLPFRIPPGVRLSPINVQTGQAVPFGTPGSFLEAFRPGTEPHSRTGRMEVKRGGVNGFSPELHTWLSQDGGSVDLSSSGTEPDLDDSVDGL